MEKILKIAIISVILFGVDGYKIRGNYQDGPETQQNGKYLIAEPENYGNYSDVNPDRLGKIGSSSEISWQRTFSNMMGQMGQKPDIFGNITGALMGIADGFKMSLPDKNGTQGGGCGPNIGEVAWNTIIPIFIIVPVVIVGIALLIYIIALIVAWIPSVTGKFFKSFMKHGSEMMEDSSGYGYGPSPGPSYGYPSTSYGSPGSPNSLSRQTAILEAIDNYSKLYGNPANPNTNGGQMQMPLQFQASPSGPSNANLQNYENYFGGQAHPDASNSSNGNYPNEGMNYPYYPYPQPQPQSQNDYSGANAAIAN